MSDLISRDQAIEAISKLPVKVDNLGYTWMIAGDVLKQIDTIPSAESERKKGEWIKEDLSGYLTPGGNSIYHCSECGHTEGPWPHPRLTNFCPSCGANMRGEDGKA